MPPLPRLLRWPVTSQQQSRRNALIACTALADLRHQRQEVDRFLDRLDRHDRRTAGLAADHPPAVTSAAL